MNKQSKSINRIPLESRVPKPADLERLMKSAMRYPGELSEVFWEGENCYYYLWARLPVPDSKNIRRQSISCADTEWILLTRRLPVGRPEISWTHTCADIEFICSLISVLPAKKNIASQDLSAELSGRSGRTGMADSLIERASPPHYCENTSLNSLLGPTPVLSGVPGRGMVLSGELSEVDLIGMLQSFALMRMSGCLEVNTGADEVSLYFEDGKLVHANHENMLASNGISAKTREQVLLDLLLWNTGRFDFRPGKKALSASVNRRLESLLMEGAMVQDYWKHLLEAGFSMDSTMYRTNMEMNSEEFESHLKAGAPVDMELQQKIYALIDEKKSLQDITTQLEVSRLKWIPPVFNLFNLKLVSFEGAHEQDTVAAPLIPADISVNKARTDLTRIDSGMLPYELLFHFMQLEFLRARKQSSYIFSLIIFTVREAASDEPLSLMARSTLAATIELVKDDLDLLAYYRDHDFIILCPCRNTEQAFLLAEEISNALKQQPLTGLTYEQMGLAFGIAAVPESAIEVVHLLSLADAARVKALKGEKLVSVAAGEAD